MEICVEYYGYADCEACCGPCSSCTSMEAISTSWPHDEANCESRAAAICSAQGTGGGTQQEYNPYQQFAGTYNEKNDEIKKIQLRESELVNLIRGVINEHTQGVPPNHDPNTHYHGYNCNPQGCAETASLTDPNTGQYSTLSDCQAACTGTCSKSCNQLVPSSFAGLIANKPCNWLQNRANAFQTKMGTLENLSCQWQRVACKLKMVNVRQIQLGC